jgi:hypothetical protein
MFNLVLRPIRNPLAPSSSHPFVCRKRALSPTFTATMPQLSPRPRAVRNRSICIAPGHARALPLITLLCSPFATFWHQHRAAFVSIT